MARKPRTDFIGAIHHIFGRGNHKQHVFADDRAKQEFLRRLLDLKSECCFKLFGFCLMSNHYHLILETGPCPMSSVMQRLLTGFSGWLNDVTDTTGHVFQGRYGAKLCGDDRYLRWLVRYVHRNPVEAGLTQDPAEWPWSSHRDFLSGRSAIVDLQTPLALFADLEAYRSFCAEPTGREPGVVTVADFAGSSGVSPQSASTLRAEDRRRFVKAAIAEGFARAEIARYLDCSKATLSRMLARETFEA